MYSYFSTHLTWSRRPTFFFTSSTHVPHHMICTRTVLEFVPVLVGDFEIVLYSTGGENGISYPLCVYCYNNPPFEDVGKVMGCNNCRHPTCRYLVLNSHVCVLWVFYATVCLNMWVCLHSLTWCFFTCKHMESKLLSRLYNRTCVVLLLPRPTCASALRATHVAESWSSRRQAGPTGSSAVTAATSFTSLHTRYLVLCMWKCIMRVFVWFALIHWWSLLEYAKQYNFGMRTYFFIHICAVRPVFF